MASAEDAGVVIVGGGYGGVNLANQLKPTGKMKIINSSDCFFHNVGALRAAVEPEFANKILIPFKETYGDSFVHGKVVSINKDAKLLTLASGETIRYSHLVLATGTAGPFPSKMMPDHPEASKDEAKQLFKSLNDEIKEAETVVMIGGGAVGTELAGEIKTDFPNKNVILIHSHKNLCSSRLKPKVQAKLQKAVQTKGIQVMLEERVENLSELQFNKCIKDQIVKTQSGKEIKADLIFRCTGLKPATDIFKDTLGAAINDRGQIKVDPFFKVEGTDDIYAIGDITDIEEEKMAVSASNHADLLGKNLKESFKGKKMKPYKSGDFMMVIPLGRTGGVSQLFGMTVGDFMTRNIKSKGLFASKYWDTMKQKMPK